MYLKGGAILANIKGVKKRILTSKKKTVLNNDLKQSMKTFIKKVEKNVQDKNLEEATKNFRIATKKIDKAVSKGVIKKNTAKRNKSRLAKKINEISGK